MNPWILGILPLLGVVLGAVLQYKLGRVADERKLSSDKRAEAYVDCLNGVARAAHLRSDDDMRDALRDLADAKARIAIYGSSAVINALAHFEESGAVIDSGGGGAAFVSMVLLMREADGEVSRSVIETLIIGSERAEPSRLGHQVRTT